METYAFTSLDSMTLSGMRRQAIMAIIRDRNPSKDPSIINKKQL